MGRKSNNEIIVERSEGLMVNEDTKETKHFNIINGNSSGEALTDLSVDDLLNLYIAIGSWLDTEGVDTSNR